MEKLLIFIFIISVAINVLECYNPEEEQVKRLEIFRKTCLKYSDDLTYEHSVLYGKQFEGSQFMPSRHNKLAICVPPKTSSQSWTILLKILHFWNEFNLTPEEKGKLEPFKNEEMSDYHKAIVVTHPLERILNVYKKYAMGEMAETHKKALEFWLQHRTDKLTPEAGEKTANQHYNILTFRQFVNFLTECPKETSECADWVSGGSGFHWAPFWFSCKNLCHHNINSIIHLSTGEADKQFVFDQTCANNSISYDEVLKANGEEYMPSQKTTEQYYGRLLKSEIYALYQKYRLDHELFGFSPDEYISLGKDDIKYLN